MKNVYGRAPRSLACGRAFRLTDTCFRCHSCAERGQDCGTPPKKSARQTITIVWEAGLQVARSAQLLGPLWEKETGCKVKVVEVPTAEMFTKIMQEYRGGHRLV